ncbi:protein JASON-like [Actinidia eriantha]|uniref:protein JASON-like n=1 Tax=Actinidia eriantha TaxID=165200 RepID=UPI00258573E5|nr:protein JASON-like [Actinidia eriantha]XP_057464354.1 protein JASON-like [Actinidia eriantha]XP_057464355.1 protein JASON-like [Actinidia eriantha]XP_057464356.1 protein JASON-like [Actinidia eriantha]
MGCFFCCFRIKDANQTHLVSEPVSSKPGVPVISRNPLSSLLLAEEKDGLSCTENENSALGTPQHDRQLMDEARFLKACGTIIETPAELRKTPKKVNDLSHCDGDSEPSKFHSWLPNISTEKFNLEKQPDQPPTPTKLCEEWTKGSDSLEHTPSSCISNGQTGRISGISIEGSRVGSITNHASSSTTSSLTARDMGTNVPCTNKSVRFECEVDAILFSSGSSSADIAASQNPKQPKSADCYSRSKPSPNPTPLKLTDEMQTPGTVFPTYQENMTNKKNPRIRSQYVYSALNPVENISQLKVLKEEGSSTCILSGHLRESLEQADNVTPKSEVGMIRASLEKDLNVESSLSSWLKPSSTNEDGNFHHSGSISVGKTQLGRTPWERPIIGMVAAHWNEVEPPNLPKYWDGNGIPNSTNKYKEDQKVSWHATPFEERLEKALSDETSIPQRKHINRPTHMDFDETEESDTAVSKLQSSTHSKPVFSI